MKIYSVNDPEFKPYGRVVTGLEAAKAEILQALATTPLPEATDYVAEEPVLQKLPAMVEVSEHLFGGMPVQLGWCNGHNTKLNCLEYHRDSEFNLGTEDFILQAPWWKFTPPPCITHPAMWTRPRASACWLHCRRAPTPPSRKSRLTAVTTPSCGPATSGCWPMLRAAKLPQALMSAWKA